MTTTLEEANRKMRAAVKERLDNTDPADEKLIGYKPPPLAGCEPAQACASELLNQAWQRESCCEGQRLRGDSLVAASDVHPTSQRFYDLCDALKAMHASKSRDYGCPSGTDPLANIRNGAAFVGIPSWKGAMVRLSDKVTRLASYNATGRLENESVADNLLDLASYSLLALLLHQEEHGV
jgi:hypothetical protein